MPKVVARQVFEYGGKMHAPGDTLEVEEKFVRILCLVGRIEPPAAPPADSSGQPYRTTSIASAPVLKDGKPAEKRKRNRESIIGTPRA